MKAEIYYTTPEGGFLKTTYPNPEFRGMNNILMVLNQVGQIIEPEIINLSPVEKYCYGKPNQIEILQKLSQYEPPDRLVEFIQFEKYLNQYMIREYKSNVIQTSYVDMAGYRIGFYYNVQSNSKITLYIDLTPEYTLIPFRFRIEVGVNEPGVECRLNLSEHEKLETGYIYEEFIMSELVKDEDKRILVTDEIKVYGTYSNTANNRRNRIRSFAIKLENNTSYEGNIYIDKISLIYNY